MAKTSLHALLTSKKYMTGFFEINFEVFCRSMALMIRQLLAFLSTVNQKSVFVLKDNSNQTRSMWALVSGKDTFCFLPFS